MDYKEKVTQSAQYLRPYFEAPPHIALLTGTGLGETADFLEIKNSMDYGQIPHFPISTVESHTGKLLAGRLNQHSILAMQGRFHLYEGYSPYDVAFPIRVMQQLGVKVLILTNASGGLASEFQPGDIMIITDHINLTGENPLAGPNVDEWGDRFPDMSQAYDKKLSSLAENAALVEKIPIRKGIYAGLKGPSLETPAEVRYLQAIGARAVGFSTVTEVIAAVHASMRVLGLSVVTNVHTPDTPLPASVEEIIQTARLTAPKLEKVIARVIASLDAS
ncbi:MAG: purine-nucleoside phosphorylase [Desulfobacteraceae bacterium]|nr:purine-nucleoside phosphorylase [Desulfobacteraceae bacterium]MBU4001865.1 purine-nucleoside phosphorylase [Pseudomonadota bacterium]MBU4053824.1 purine-nucleoside phosphorylase [Pseudomonadota bacterium]